MHAAPAAIRPVTETPPLRLVPTTPACWPESEPAAVREQRLAPGQTLFHDGDAAQHFFEIVSGTVRCCRLTPDGRRQIYRFAGAGDMLALGGEPVHSYSAEAVGPVVVRRRRLAALDAAMSGDARLRERVIGALREELAAVRLQMVLLGQMSAVERVAAFLISLAARAAQPGAAIHLPMTRVDIADYLGLTIETVSRQVTSLKKGGVVELTDARSIRVPDYGALLEAAGEDADGGWID